MITPTRITLISVLALASLAATTACTSESVAHESSSPATVAATSTSAGTWTPPHNGATVDVPTFATALTQAGVILLDVRTPEEFAAGHLKDAKNKNFNSADFAASLTTLPKDAVYAVYCRSGNRSQSALNQMMEQGFAHTFHLGGGIKAWQAAGHPVVQGR